MSLGSEGDRASMQALDSLSLDFMYVRKNIKSFSRKTLIIWDICYLQLNLILEFIPQFQIIALIYSYYHFLICLLQCMALYCNNLFMYHFSSLCAQNIMKSLNTF